MDYIYAELNKNLIPRHATAYYGFCVGLPEFLPKDAKVCDDYSHLASEGWCRQKYELKLSEVAKYPYFAYPVSHGQLKGVLVNQIFDIGINWVAKVMTVNSRPYYFCYYKNKLGPGQSVMYTFKTLRDAQPGEDEEEEEL